MRRNPLKWFFVLLLCAAGLWLLFYESHTSKNKGSSAAQSNSLAGAKSSVNHAASTTNTLKTGAAGAVTNRFAWRLSNTSKPIKQLIHDPHAILLENAFIDTRSNLNLSIPKNLQAKGDPGAYVVQARGPISPAFRILLADVGATIVSYVPNNAYLVRATQAIADGLAANPLVQAVVPYEPYYKVQPQLISMANQSLPQSVQLNLALFPGNAQDAIQQITQNGGRVLNTQNSPAGYTIVTVEPPSDWTAIADLPIAHIVETVQRRAVANDLARPSLGIAVNSVTQTNYMNLYGSNVLIELNDDGVDTNHPDFSNGNTEPPRIFGFGTNTADDGHGTHVAGIIAGDGKESMTVTNASGSIMPGTNGQFRGKAPFAQVLSVNYGDDDETLQETAATNDALISNNSWNYFEDYDYDLAAASYDAATRDALPFVTGSQPVAFVFVAGNDGNTAGSVDSPGTAKDVITVGALEELRYITNQVTNADGTVSQPWLGETDNSSAVADFSSCGNVGIGTEGTYGRFKPDVVAPGTFVVSTRSLCWDTAAYYNPTNSNYYTFADYIPTNSVSVSAMQFFVPSNAVGVTFQTVTNNLSPNPLPPLPIYASTNGSGVFTFIGNSPTNVSYPIDGSALDLFWSVVVSNTTASPLSYDLIVDVLTTNNNGNYYLVLSNLNQNLGDQSKPQYYRYESGTSMSAGAISGFLALMQDYFTNQFYQPFTPSPALLKALTINGARPTAGYDFQVNNSINYEGWGLPDLSNSIPLGLTNVPSINQVNMANPPFCSTFFREQSPTNALATGDSETFTVHLNGDVFANFNPLRVTLAWTDPPGDPIAALKLVNSLELVVTDLDNPGVVYYGNDIGPGQIFNNVESSTNPPIIDTINNIQNIYIQPVPMLGAEPDTNYSVTVIGNSVNVNAVSAQTNNVVQDFALVISSGDMGLTSNALQVTDGGIISNPTGDQNITIGQTNTILLNQIAGANTPLLGYTNVPFTTNTIGIGTNGQFTIGMTNQWHFYVITNNTSYTNAAFITFGANTLSIPRMGVFANSEANATTPGADLDLLVAAYPNDPNAAGLMNLAWSVVSNCVNNASGDGSSLVSGGTDFVAYTNAQSTQVYYIGVKSESQMAVEYSFIPIFTDTPFSQLDQNGNEYLSALNVPVPIPDGTSSHPGVAFVFSLALYPIEIQDVIVTNIIQHQNFGDLVGSLTHSGTTVVLNSHDSLPNPPGPYTLIYDDTDTNDVPGSQNTAGPGSLRDYLRTAGEGVWQMTQEGTAIGQTGEVLNTSIFLQKYQNPGQGIYATIQPDSWFYTYLDVPNGVTNLQLYGAYADTSVQQTPPLQMYLNTGGDPTFTDYLFEASLINPPPMPTLPPPLQQQPGYWNVISDGPPLQSGTYYIGVYNPSLVAQTVYLAAILNGPSTPPQPQLFSSTNASPITVDAVTNTTIYVSNTNTIQSVNVGMVVQSERLSDLAFTLISPTGQRILLMENRGGPTATNAGGVFYITNSIGVTTANGSYEPNTNFINTGANSGTFNISWNMYTIPDQMTVYYGNDPATFYQGSPEELFNSGLVSGTGTTNITYGTGTSTYVTVIMNQFGNTNAGSGDAWTYSINGVSQDFNYLTFTDDTNLTTTPIKFAIPPFDLRDMGTNYTFGDLDFATNGDYFGQTNIYDAFGGWTVPTNLVTQVISNTFVVTNNYNEVSVVSNPAVAFNGTNYLALGYGVIQRTNIVTPYRLVTFNYEYRGPGIAGWWRGEGNANDSSDAEQHGQNGSLIGRFSFPAGEVSQAFQMENNGQEYDFAGTNSYVQIRQQPFLTQVFNISTNGDNTGTNEAIVQSSYLDVGTGPGLTVEGWINPTNVSFQQPLVEWLARVPTNGSDTNLTIKAGPFLYRGTDNYYYLIGATNWPTSETWAEELGGHLVTINSADEQNWVFDTFGAYGGKNRNLWIGLTNYQQGSFGYVSGVTNIAYTNWMSFQPTNCDGTKNYTFMWGSTNLYPGLWTLSDSNGFICDSTNTNIIYGVVEVPTTNFQTNGVQFWISVTNVPGTTNLINVTNGCLFADLVDITNGSHWIYSGPNLVQSNVWQHVALTYDTNSGNAMLFYDGTNVATTNWGVTIIPKTTGDVLLGKDMSLLTNNYYGGQMDEMSIYNRALSDTEIQAIYSVSAYTTNRLIGKFDPTITPPLSLAEAQVVIGNMTNTILGQNNTWQQGSFSFETQTNLLPMQIMGIEPGMLFDSFGFSQAPLGNLYYQPEQSLDDLQGENASGPWTLEIWDTRLNTPATNAVLLSWQLQMILQTNALPPVTIGSQEPTTVTVLPGQTVTLAVPVPPWASTAQNTLVTSTVPLNVYFNATNLMDASPPDVPILGTPPAIQSGSELLTTTSIPTQTNFTPGATYYIGLQNPGSTAATAVFEVNFNITALANAVPFNDTLTNGFMRYFSFDVSTNNPYEATFQLLNMSGNCDLVVSKGTPLPTLTSSDYGSFNSGKANENIYVLTNSMPVPLSPGEWYLGVFNRTTNSVNYTVLAQEMDAGPPASGVLTTNLIPLTNGVPFDYTAGPGADLTNFFTFVVTNTVTTNGITLVTNNVSSIHFELYNLTGNGDLTVQTNAPPYAPPFYQSSQEPGTIPEFIQIVTNSTLTNLDATYYLGVPNETTNLIHFTIIAVIDTNTYFPAFPGAEGAGASALGASIRNGYTNNTVYHVVNLNDSGPGSLRDAVSSTNRTIIFDTSGVIYLQNPLVITNSYLTIAGQTAPPGGITIADAPMIVSTNVHDVVIRYLRFRPNYSVPAQNLYVANWYPPGAINKFTPSAAQSTFVSGGLGEPEGLAFDTATNLYVANSEGGTVYKVTPAGAVSTFASGMNNCTALAFNSARDLFVADYNAGAIYEITPAGVRTTFASGLMNPAGLAFNNAGDLFVTDRGAGNVYEYTPNGVRSTIDTGLSQPFPLAFSRGGNLFVGILNGGSNGSILEITPGGVKTTVATGFSNLNHLAFNNAGDLFLANNVVTRISPAGKTSAFYSNTGTLGNPTGVAFDSLMTNLTVSDSGGDCLQFNTASNVIADHISALWSSNDDLSVLNSSNITVQWSILSDTLTPTNGQPPPFGAQVRYGSGTVSLHHNLFADNYTGSPRLGDNISLDFVNNVIYNWVTNAGYSSSDDITNNPAGFTNYLNYICNYLIAGSNTVTTNIAFWSGTNTTWIFQTNNFIDSDINGYLNGANTKWDMFTNWGAFTNLYMETNQFRLPPVSVDEAYMAYEKVLDFAGVSMFKREPAESNIVENVRQQDGTIINSPGVLPTLSSTTIYQDSANDGIPDFWKITYGQFVTNTYNNFALDSSGYSELEEFDNWLAGPHALTVTNTSVGVDLYKLFGKTGHLSFFLTNAIHGTVYLTNVLNSYTNTALYYSNTIAIFTPTNSTVGGTNYYGFASFDVYVTNNDTVAYFGPVTVSVFVSAVTPMYSSMTGPITGGVPVTNTIPADTIQWYLISVPTNAVMATNSLLFVGGGPVNLWYSTNAPPTVVYPSDFELLTDSTNGSAVINSSGAPLPPILVPGGTYYLGVQNTNNYTTNYAVQVTFDTPSLPPGIIIITPGQPITNIIPGISSPAVVSPADASPNDASAADSPNPTYVGILVPPNAVTATNTFVSVTGGTVSLWFNQNNLPLNGYSGDYELIANDSSSTPVSAVLNTNGVPPPPLVPNQVYYLAITNNSSTTVTDVFVVNFGLSYTPPILPALSNTVVSAGSTLTVTNTATDTNAGTLYYTLMTDPSVDATISSSGIITWDVPTNTPAETVLFTTVVSNSYTTLTATNSFDVTVIPLVSIGQPQPVTNSVPTNTIQWITVNVPIDADWATNTLLFSSNLPVNILFTTNFPPTTAIPSTLMSGVTSGDSVLGLDTVPTNITSGGVYYIGIQNLNNTPVNTAFQVTFGLYSPPVLPAISNIVIIAGSTLTVTNTATDTNAGTLFYTLATSPSVDATISANGVITWATSANQPPGNFLFETIVTNSLTTLGATNYFQVTVVRQPPSIPFAGIIETNIGGTNGFLLSWYAPTSDVFQVQETASFQPQMWETFSNTITYTGPMTPTNGLFQFFDNGSQYPFGPMRFYKLLLLLQAVPNTLTLPVVSNYVVSVSEPFVLTNTATDSDPAATLVYSLAQSPFPSTNATISTDGIFNWEPGPTDAGQEFKFTTTVSDNGLPPASAQNQFTVFVPPAPSITGATVTSTNVTLQWTASSNDIFQVQWTTNLDSPVVWQAFPQTMSSTTGSFTFTDTNAPATMKFYRLLWLPLP